MFSATLKKKILRNWVPLRLFFVDNTSLILTKVELSFFWCWHDVYKAQYKNSIRLKYIWRYYCSVPNSCYTVSLDSRNTDISELVSWTKSLDQQTPKSRLTIHNLVVFRGKGIFAKTFDYTHNHLKGIKRNKTYVDYPQKGVFKAPTHFDEIL